MRITLYSLPYVVAIASLLVAAQEIVPTLKPNISSAIGDSYFGQTVNRASKSDRQPVKHLIPHNREKDRIPTEDVIRNIVVVVDPSIA